MFVTIYTFSTSEEYRALRETIQRDIQNILGENQSFLIDVAINEAVNNALKSNLKKKPISIYFRVTPGRRLIIRVKDQGDGFNANDVLTKISPSQDTFFDDKLLDESGRGLAIMKCASDKMFYNREGNELLLMKYIDQEAEVCQ